MDTIDPSWRAVVRSMNTEWLFFLACVTVMVAQVLIFRSMFTRAAKERDELRKRLQ